MTLFSPLSRRLVTLLGIEEKGRAGSLQGTVGAEGVGKYLEHLGKRVELPDLASKYTAHLVKLELQINDK